MNKVVLIGYLTKDPDLRYTQSGRAVCQFTLAVNKNLSKDKKEEMEAQNKPTADFPRIIVWGKMGENASRYLKKGSQCAIDGAIQTGSYQDNNGNRVFTTDIVAQHVEFLNKTTQDGTDYKTLDKVIKIILRAIMGRITIISLMMILKRCKMMGGFRFR